MGTPAHRCDPESRIFLHVGGSPSGTAQVWSQHRVPGSMLGMPEHEWVWSAPLSMASVAGGAPTRTPHAFNVAAEVTYIQSTPTPRLWFAAGTEFGGTPVWCAADDPTVTAP